MKQLILQLIKKDMIKTILVTAFLAITYTTSAQNSTNSLSGYYKVTKKDALYTSIHLDGNGHALISDSFQAEYFQKDDLLYVFPDKSVFIFKIDKNQLKGISNWVAKSNYKKTEVPLNDDYERNFSTYVVNPNLLYEFYLLNFEEGTDEMKLDVLNDPEAYNAQLEKLCAKGLTSACGALFGMKYMEAAGGLSEILNDNATTIKEDKQLEKLAQQMIDAEDFRGYSLLGSYYYALGNVSKAKEIYTEGAEKGDEQSALVLFSLELEEDVETTESEFVE